MRPAPRPTWLAGAERRRRSGQARRGSRRILLLTWPPAAHVPPNNEAPSTIVGAEEPEVAWRGRQRARAAGREAVLRGDLAGAIA